MTRLMRPLLALSLLAFTTSIMAEPCKGEDGVRPDVEKFIAQMVKKHQFRAEELCKLFGEVHFIPNVVNLMTPSPLGKTVTWEDYRKNFVNTMRIRKGVQFWNENAAAIAKASADHGVPAQILVAIIGVETIYGRRTGKYRLIDTLTTLAFDYPRRADFYLEQLENFLLLTRDLGLAPQSLQGSFAGATGIPQFIPSSYRKYAIDGDGDGYADIWTNPADAIASIANYLRSYGWETGKPVAQRISVTGENFREVLGNGTLRRYPIEELERAGAQVTEPVAPGTAAMLLEMGFSSGNEYWLGFNNFYAITRYNKSLFYAMAVFQLSEELRRARETGRP
jgi:membrane-bound lytic murein transglycosylase B